MTWPELETATTSRTLQLWTQIVGKTRLVLAPMTNHWWQVTLRVSTRGLTTSLIPYESRAFEVELDLIDHHLVIRSSDGGVERFPLEASDLASFWEKYFAALGRLGIRISIDPLAVEIPETIHLDRDRDLREYDPDWAHRFFLVLVHADRLLTEFRSRFLGKVSPVHFFWGGFDIAVTRFSGRTAPRHPGGIPHCADYVSIEAYSHEVSSAGFWSGDAKFPSPAFYAYAYPEPPGFSKWGVIPDAAEYVSSLGLFALRYDSVRGASSPDRDVLAFLQSTYEAAAETARWNRAELEHTVLPQMMRDRR